MIKSDSHVNRIHLAAAHLGPCCGISAAHVDIGSTPSLSFPLGSMTGLGIPHGHKGDAQSYSREKKPQILGHSEHLKRSYLPTEEVSYGDIYEMYLCFQMPVSVSSWLNSVKNAWILLT